MNRDREENEFLVGVSQLLEAIEREGGQPEPHHYGLTIMRERAASLHGEIDLANRPGGGTIVRLRFQAERIDSDLPGETEPQQDPNP